MECFLRAVVLVQMKVLAEFCRELDYEYILFDSIDGENRPIYHTNVMMCIAQQVIMYMESIPSRRSMATLRACFRSAGREIVGYQKQVLAFAQICLHSITSKSGKPLLVMSKVAYES